MKKIQCKLYLHEQIRQALQKKKNNSVAVVINKKNSALSGAYSLNVICNE